MFRPSSLLPALAAAVAVVGLPVAAHAQLPTEDSERAPVGVVAHRLHTLQHARAAAADEQDPLAVTIDSLSPSTIPARGPVQISGSITNTTDTPWTAINVEAFISGTPITSTSELADAALVDPGAYVGDRITVPGTFDTLTTLDPGETAQFMVRVPRGVLGVTDPGVYWFGIHALGQGPEGRDENADGRARTFLPLVPPRTHERVNTALVLPLRGEILHAADGSIADPDRWTRTLSPGGSLRSLVDFGASAGSRKLTWLIDPALPDAVRSLVAGNPPRSIDPTVPEGQEKPESSPAATPSPTVQPTAPPSDPPAAADDPTAVAAEAWLERLHEALGDHKLLALPYGDIDVAAAAEHDPALYALARRRSGTTLQPWGLPLKAAVGAPSGFLDRQGIRTVERAATLLVTDRALGDDPPTVAKTAGHRLTVTSSGAASGGPGPDDPYAPVALRQRILSEAAVRLLSAEPKPLVVLLPGTWDSTATTGFFQGLDVDWLHLTSIGKATKGHHAEPVPVDELHYPRRQGDHELDAANFSGADALIRIGETLQNTLLRNDTVAGTVADEALTGASYASREHPDASRVSADRSRVFVEHQLGSITVDAPRAVTLASANGSFSATLVNNLDQPVTVRIAAAADEPLTITGPERIDIAANARATILLDASTRTLGVHNVRLIVTDKQGEPLGSTDEVPIRSAAVSNVIWVILGTGVVLLFGAIAVRLFRRVRAAAKAAKAEAVS